MTLDEAIRHAEEKAESLCGECASNHRKLATWLKELKWYREREIAEIHGKQSEAV